MKVKFLTIATVIASIYNCAPQSKLVRAVENNDLQEIKLLLDKGHTLDDYTECRTPLAAASWDGNEEITQFLLEKGANPNSRNRECFFKETMSMAGMNYNFHYKKGNHTPLLFPKTSAIAKLLLAKGANPNLGSYVDSGKGVRQELPLTEAIKNRKLILIDLLLQSKKIENAYSYPNGKNVYLNSVFFLKNQYPEEFSKVSKILQDFGFKDFTFNEKMIKDTSNKVFNTYKHLPTGSTTTMDPILAKDLFDNPQKFAPLTISAHDNKYYHYSEFVWTDNNQNLFEWYLLRRANFEDPNKK